MITLDQLRALVALKETGSFSNAAEALHKAQSAITYAIKSLESELGLTLLDRSGYRATFTPAGQAILRKAQQMLDLAGDIDGLALSLKEGWEPRINIVTHALLPINNIIPFLSKSLSSKYPTQLSLRVEILSGVTESIKLFQPEIVVTPLDSVEVPRNYGAVKIGAIDLIPVVSRNHPLAKENPPIPLTTLRKHVHLIVSDSARSPKQLDFLVIGAEEQWNFPDFYTRREGLRAGLGFAWMPTYLIEDDVKEGRLVPITLEGQNLHSYDVGIVYRKTPMLGPAGQYLLELLRKSEEVLPKASDELIAIYA